MKVTPTGRGPIRTALTTVVATLVATAGLATIAPAAPAAPRVAGVRPEVATVTAPPAAVDVALLPPAVPERDAELAAVARPELPAEPVLPGPAVPPAESLLAPLDGRGVSAAGGPTPVKLHSFTGITRAASGRTPPDTQLAVGPTHVVEFTNSIGRVYDKAGTQLSSFNLSAFFGGPAIVMAQADWVDPRVYYDPLSARFFAVILVTDRCAGCATERNSDIRLAVSQTNSATGSWWIYSIETNAANMLLDQPKLGVSSDKVVVTHNDFTTTYQGVRYVVVERAHLTAGAAASVVLFARDSARHNVIPARSLTATTTHYATQASGSTMTVFRFTGTPAAGTTTFTTSTVSIGTLADPPDAQQPGTTTTIETNTSAIQSAVWRGNVLWSAAHESCTPSGDTAARACLRFVNVSTSGTPPTLTSDTRISMSGNYLYYPSVVTTGAGDVYAGYTISGSSRYASAGILYGQNGSLSGSVPAIFYAVGVGAYSNGTPNRWGDYSEIAVDPSNADDVWTAQEYGSTSTTDTTQWATAIGQFTSVAPVVTSITPTSGPSGGGTVVEINGRGFANPSSVGFGGFAGTSFTWVNSTRVRATSPFGTAGTVHVTVQTAAGTSATSTATQFTYLAPSITSVSPNQGANTGGQTVTITGNNFLNASTVRFGTVTASFTVNSNTQITATSPAHSNGTVDVRVTAGGSTSAIVVADRYTFVSPPTVTGVNPPAGPTTGGISVTITGTGFTGATSVRFGTAAASFTVTSSTQIVATLPAVPATQVGFVDVRVTANGATSPVTANDRFLYV